MTLSFWHRTHRDPAAEVDMAVVGGGIIGCSTAYWLHRLDPTLRIAIVEAGELAQGASGRNAGFLLQGTSTDYVTDIDHYGATTARRLWAFTRANRELIQEELRPAAFQLEATGSLILAGSADEEQRLHASVPRMRADGAPAAFIPADDSNRRVRGRGFGGGLYVPSGAMLDPVALVRHIAKASTAACWTHHPVVDLDTVGDAIRLETPRRPIRASRVVLALNAYLPRLIPALGRYVRPVRAQMLATEPAADRWLPVPVYTHQGFFYVRQRLDGTVLVGGARHLHADTEVGYDDATTEALQRDLEAYLHHHFPQTRSLAVAHRWSGTMGFSPDHLPVYGAVPGLPQALWAAGFTGHGMGYGFRFGRLLAEAALGREQPEDGDLFHVSRFESAPAQVHPLPATG